MRCGVVFDILPGNPAAGSRPFDLRYVDVVFAGEAPDDRGDEARFGRHRLAPKVSPKKSWEGILGGTLLTAFGVWFCRTVFYPELSPTLAVGTGFLLAVLSPLGDLVESLLKRDAGVKDSSDLLPGHGGFLDRSDSLFFAAPFVLALFLAFGGSG